MCSYLIILYKPLVISSVERKFDYFLCVDLMFFLYKNLTFIYIHTIVQTPLAAVQRDLYFHAPDVTDFFNTYFFTTFHFLSPPPVLGLL